MQNLCRVSLVIAALVAAGAVSNCKSKGGGADGATKTLALGKTGFVVDAPEGWSVKSPMDGFFTVKGGRHQSVQIMVSHMAAPKSVDELADQRCKGQKDLVKKTLPGGGFFVQCKGPAQGIKIQGTNNDLITTKIESVVPSGDQQSLSCEYETDGDPATIAAVCASLRKK